MREIDIIRKKYGISLSEMAWYLDSTKSHTAKAERLERPLTSENEKQLLILRQAVELHKHHETQEIVRAHKIQDHASILRNVMFEVRYRLIKNQRDAERMTKKLQKARKAYQDAETLIGLLPHLQELTENGGKENLRSEVWLSERRQDAQKKMTKFSPRAQLFIELSINRMIAEIPALRRKLDETFKELLALIPDATMVTEDEVKAAIKEGVLKLNDRQH